MADNCHLYKLTMSLMDISMYSKHRKISILFDYKEFAKVLLNTTKFVVYFIIKWNDKLQLEASENTIYTHICIYYIIYQVHRFPEIIDLTIRTLWALGIPVFFQFWCVMISLGFFTCFTCSDSQNHIYQVLN
jgi:hypothetical protein